MHETITPLSTLHEVDEYAELKEKAQTYYTSGERKLLHMMRWVRPDIYKKNKNASTAIHVKAMHCVMKYCVSTSDRGWKLKPTR